MSAFDTTELPEGMTPLDVGRAILAAQPFNELVGARITRFEDGEAVLELDIDDRHRQQYGVVHGGVYAYLIDNALTFACGTVLGASIITSGMSATYLAAGRDGTLRATGIVTATGRGRAVATVTIDEVAPDGAVRTCAVGQGTAIATNR